MRRIKKALKIAAIVVGVLIAIGLIGNGIWIHVTGSALEQKLAALRAEGQPLSIADLAHKPIPAETNAATYLRRAKDSIGALEKEVVAPFDDQFGNDDPLLAENDAQKIRSVFDAYPELIPLLEQAANCPDYDSQLDYSGSWSTLVSCMLEPIQFNREVARVLKYHSLLLESEGKQDEALRDNLTLLTLVRGFDREPALVNYLVCCTIRSMAVQQANRILQNGTIAPASRRALDEELAKHDSAEPLKGALRSERAFGLSMFHDTIPWGQHWVTRGMVNSEISYYVDFMGREIAAADEPFWKHSKQAVNRLHVLTSLIIPALLATRTADASTQARFRCLRVLNALQALPESEQNQEPKLSGLKLPREATVDPFTGNELHVKKLPAGWLVYSVGRDLKDDGGKLAEDLDVGVGPLRPPGEPKKTVDDDQK